MVIQMEEIELINPHHLRARDPHIYNSKQTNVHIPFLFSK